MKKTITLFLMLSAFIMHSQEDIKKYKGGEMYLIVQDTKTNKQVKKPYGKILSIEYNSFYKSYFILYQMEEGATGFGLEYLNEFKVSDGICYRMKEKGKSIYYDVYDRLENSGTITIINKKEYEGMVGSYQIINCKLE